MSLNYSYIIDLHCVRMKKQFDQISQEYSNYTKKQEELSDKVIYS